MGVMRACVPGLTAAVFMLAGCATVDRPATGPLALLPQPKSVVASAGSYAFDARTRIGVPSGDADAQRAAQSFADLIRKTRGFDLAIGEQGAVHFVREAGMPKEGYRLEVKPGGATITASDASGFFYGGVTLWQLATSGPPGAIKAVTITDAPRFGWRGLMIDSARHYQSPEFIKLLIDAMAAHKLNVLHWHLTDDQGWRIEIVKYPRLTEVGAWRTPASVAGTPKLPQVGGFYTQAQVREIVAYASARAITVVPEIEMPGHALAPIRAYPALGTGVVPEPGIESGWGVFPYLFNVEEPTFDFIEDVLVEVLAMFPSTFIHVGGDEAVKDQWKASPQVQARMRALGITDENKMQSWFIGRIGRFLEARGRRLIGWDEILEGGLPANATVMSWQGIDGAVKAAKAGHDTVLAPAPTLYVNNRQGGTASEPPGRGEVITLANVYAFDPAPASIPADQQRHILGLQANLWTEHVRTEKRFAHKAFPRVSAVAEIGWSGRGSDFSGFTRRLLPQIDRLSKLGIDAAPSAFQVDMSERVDPATGRVEVKLGNQIGSEIRYSVDGSEPSLLYAAPLDIALPARLRAVAIDGGRILPGAIDRALDATSVRRRDDTQLKLCTNKIVLSLEDDAPAAGPRAVFLTDIMNPCWTYEAAPMDGVSSIAIDLGQIPFNFQIGKDIDAIRFAKPATEAGEFEVRSGGCEGARIAVLPLAPATGRPALTTLTAAIAPMTGAHDLCFTYTARGPDPLWAIDAVQLIAAK